MFLRPAHDPARDFFSFGGAAMRLTVHTDYALRVLIYAAVNAGRLATIDDVARAYGISKNHLRKVVHRLSQGGYLETVQGRRGGIRLKLRPEHIGVGEIVRQMEPDLALVECLGERGQCRIYAGCTLRSAIEEARSCFLGVLDNYRLSDLLARRRELGQILGAG
jgi:Rrf2 family nitric oxide-sensitive transcriptional repressor